MSNTLKFGAGEWATKKGSTLAYNSENGNFKPLPFTFDRAGSATRVNKQGLIEVVSNNEPRIDFLNDSKGALLLEPQRSNLITYSEDFNGTGWAVFGGSGGTCTRTLNYGISPDGTQNSTRAVFSDGNTALYFNISISVASTATIYVKGTAGEVIGFGFGSSVAGGSDFTFNGEWQRLVFSGSSGGSVTINTWLAAANARDFEIWGAQLEEGSYATSYIPTQGSQVTRVVDTCSQTPPSGIIGQTEGTLFVEVTNLKKILDSVVISLSDGSFANYLQVSTNASTGNLQSVIFTGGSVGVLGVLTTNINQRYKIAIGYKLNDYALYINGSQIGTLTSKAAPSSLTRLDINGITWVGSGYEYSNPYNSAIIYNTRLSNAELQALTTI